MDNKFRIVVAGCRNFTDYEKVKKRLEFETWQNFKIEHFGFDDIDPLK